MNLESLLLIAVLAIAVLITLALAPVMRMLALRLRIVDEPDARKIHAYPVPYLGGLAMYVAVMLGYTFIGLVFPQVFQERIFALALATSIFAMVGVVDDIVGLSAWHKLPFEILAALLLCAAGIQVNAFHIPFTGVLVDIEPLSWFLTVLWVVGLANTINLLDGLDGLAAGVVCIAAGANLFMAALFADVAAMSLYLLIIGACVGFLRFNWHPARIFMGDTGSLLLGFMLAAAILMSEGRQAMLFAILPIGLPLFDVLLAIVRRHRQGRHIFQADREHLHHRLLGIGLAHRSVVIVYYVLSFYFGICAIIMLQLPPVYMPLMFLLYGMGLLMAWMVLRFIEGKLSRQLDDAGQDA